MKVPAGRMDVVDIDVDPLTERSRRRRTLARIGMPIGGVGLIIAFLLGIAVYADRANRAGVLGLSDTLLHAMQERIALEVFAYLYPASHATLLAHSMLGRGGATGRAEDAYAFAASVLNETPQAANVLFADGAGNFMLVRRAVADADQVAAPGSTETKRIQMSPEGRTVMWVTRDRSGAVTARHADPTDTYDARTRSWFTGARDIDEVFWSGVYVFFSERAPGVTVAAHGPDADPDVVGIDIRLDAISKFLGGLSIGQTGRAYIVSKAGEMIGGPDPSRILVEQNGQLSPATVNDVGDAGLAGSWDHFRVQGAGTRVIEVGGQRLISIVTALDGNQQGWLLVITVPEAEFTGFITVNSRRAILFSLIVIALAAGLGLLLVRQGLRADRADRAVADRSEAVRQQSEAFARLAIDVGRFAPNGTPPRAITETLAEATGARRAGVWRLVGKGQVLRCEDSFEPATAGHVVGVELSRQEVPALIEALARGEEIDANDARRDRRTVALHGLLMAPLGSISLFAVPIVRRRLEYDADGARETVDVLGVLLLEDARRDPAARDITRACATLVGLRMPAETPAASSLVAARTTSLVPEPASDNRGLDASLFPAALDGLAVQTKARVSVLVLRLPELAMARIVDADGGGAVEGNSLAHRIACGAHEIAVAHGIPYMKMTGAVVVAACGHTALDNSAAADAAMRLADTAIALREFCSRLFDAGEDEDEDEFNLGLDAGAVFGGMLGRTAGGSGGVFNLWGEAFRGAELLAGSAPFRTIQVSEQSYLLLRKTFLFRPRGLFHRPGVGDARCYVLAGRA